jgi:Domain of unknown function (DUF4352)
MPLEDAATQSIAPELTGASAPATAAAPEMANNRQTPSWFEKKRFALPATVLLVLVIIIVGTGGNDPKIFDFTTSAQESKAESAVGTSAAATMGQSVRDGEFSFIVTSVLPPSKFLTDRAGTTQTAQGEFVIVRLSVTNIGHEPRTVTATDQFLISDQGQRFATSAAISSLQGSEKILLEKVNPGNTVYDVPMLFDVVPGTRIAEIELHDSIGSAGVKVKLR